MALSEYLSSFLSLNTNKRLGQVAPHKAVMLLSVIDLVESGMIAASTFSLTEPLEKKFLQNWKRYVGTSILFKPTVATPFWHMQHEPFWKLHRNDGLPMDEISATPSISKVRQCGMTATIDKDLFAQDYGFKFQYYMDQPKIERMLRLMKMLSGNINYTVDELSERLDMSQRTIYRYIDTFKNAGFTVTKLFTNTYKLEKMPKSAPDLERLMYFSEEESYLINSLLDALVPTNALKKGIKDKLSVICDATCIADYVDRRSNAAHVTNLTQAAREKKKVILKGYESGNSHTILDRYVEPYGFTTDYIDVCAYDLEDKQNKIFKIQRIGEVEILDEPWEFEKSHRKQGMDVFRMTGHYIGHIKWQMTVMAKNLLLEEFPLAERDLKRQGNFWILDADICNYAGACRFYVGLAPEIKVIDSPEFEEYVKEYVNDNLI